MAGFYLSSLLPVLILLRSTLAAPSDPNYSNPSPEFRHPDNGICNDYSIKQEVTSANYVWALDEFKTNYDVVGFVDNWVRKGSSVNFQPLKPEPKNDTNTYEIVGTFCTPKDKKDGKENTVLVTTHGLGYDRRYWASSYKPEEFSFVDLALGKGYSVFYYDRLGTGKSQKISGYVNQGSIQVSLLKSLVQSVKEGKYTGSIKASKTVLVGHSFGSYISNALIAEVPDIVDGAVLTGIGYPSRNDTAGIAQQWALEAFAPRTAPSKGYNNLDTGYFAYADIYAHIGVFFEYPNFDNATAEYAQSIANPLGIVEYLSLAKTNLMAQSFKGPVLVTTGENDFLVCNGECQSTYATGQQKDFFKSSKKLETYLHPGAGHGINFAQNATVFYETITSFLDRNL